MPDLCPVYSCGMHLRFTTWLETGEQHLIVEFWPLAARFRTTTWRRCTCQLYERLQALMEPATP